MIPGTTPRHTFTLPFDPPEGSDYRIVYAQGKEYAEKIVLELTTERCTIKGREISVDLTQAETLMFDRTPYPQFGKPMPLPVRIQVGMETPGGRILWSDIITTSIDRLLREDGRVADG